MATSLICRAAQEVIRLSWLWNVEGRWKKENMRYCSVSVQRATGAYRDGGGGGGGGGKDKS